jgi:tRNA dimethylallyltransferase
VSARPRLVAIVGPTATGKSALGIALARRCGGEIVNCDSTAVYRGFDIGTDKVPVEARQGIPHHLVDVVDPTDEYSAAEYARDAARAIRDITARGRTPIVVGGTGLYFRALTRGFFPGPGRDEALRARLDRIAQRRGDTRLHALLRRVDPASASRIAPRDRTRVIRALEVYVLTRRTLTDHFAATEPPLPEYDVAAFALSIPPDETARRVEARVHDQFARGLLDEVRGLLASGVPRTANPFKGLVYRQVLEHLEGVRDEADTRALITRENRQYSRRQLIWFRKEPNLLWISAGGDHLEALLEVERALATWGMPVDGPDT